MVRHAAAHTPRYGAATVMVYCRRCTLCTGCRTAFAKSSTLHRCRRTIDRQACTICCANSWCWRHGHGSSTTVPLWQRVPWEHAVVIDTRCMRENSSGCDCVCGVRCMYASERSVFAVRDDIVRMQSGSWQCVSGSMTSGCLLTTCVAETRVS